MVGEDEDLGGSYRVEPFLDPAPHSREEGWGADNLSESVSFSYDLLLISRQHTNIRSNVSG